MPTRVRSFCKINLGLAVGPARADGFHGLTTLYQTLALHDFVTVAARAADATKITLTANHPGVPCTATGDAERNTAWKMVAGALTRLGMTAEVRIEIDKRLPVQGGLGAGSANAVAALLGLERELGQSLPGPERLRLAEGVGSDVPLFLLGGSVLGLGRGEQVFPLPDLPATYCVVAVPSVGVSTGAAFRDLDARMAVRPQGVQPVVKGADGGTAEAVPLTKRDIVSIGLGTEKGNDSTVTSVGHGLENVQPLTSGLIVDKLKQLSRALAAIYTMSGVPESNQTGVPGPDSGITRRTGDLAENPLLALVRTGIENDFEEVAFSQHPSLRSTKRDLVGVPPGGTGSVLYAALSGSGSALFGLYSSLDDARAAQQRVQRNGTEAILTETLPRSEYWKRMFA